MGFEFGIIYRLILLMKLTHQYDAQLKKIKNILVWALK